MPSYKWPSLQWIKETKRHNVGFRDLNCLCSTALKPSVKNITNFIKKKKFYLTRFTKFVKNQFCNFSFVKENRNSVHCICNMITNWLFKPANDISCNMQIRTISYHVRFSTTNVHFKFTCEIWMMSIREKFLILQWRHFCFAISNELLWISS